MQRCWMVGVALVATCVASCGGSDKRETAGSPASTVQASTASTAGQPAQRVGRDHPRDAGGFSVIAVRRGDIALEVWGDRKEPVVEIAKLAVSRVK